MTTKCDACGEPIGHADEIVEEYENHETDGADWDNIVAFGSTECRRLYEEHHDLSPEDRRN